jgi:HlyD family secretion protein
MTTLKPIPIPLRQRWRQFKMRLLPALVFCAAACGALYSWDQQGSPGSMVGEVYARAGTINAPVAGMVEGRDFNLFDRVFSGQTLATVRSMPGEQAELALAVLLDEIAMIRIGAGEPVMAHQRNFLSWQELRRDLLMARADLAALRVRIGQAENDARRAQSLAIRGGVSLAEAEQASTLHAALRAEESEKDRLVASLAAALEGARDAHTGEAVPDLAAGITAALDWKESELRRFEAELQPLPVSVPFDGIVTQILRRPGDFVTAGEPIVEIRSEQPEMIIGYLKQPLATSPKVGMEVEVVPRVAAGTPMGARCNVINVGAAMCVLPPELMRPSPIPLAERALPIQISLPDTLSLKPGEIVDIRLPRP